MRLQFVRFCLQAAMSAALTVYRRHAMFAPDARVLSVEGLESDGVDALDGATSSRGCYPLHQALRPTVISLHRSVPLTSARPLVTRRLARPLLASSPIVLPTPATAAAAARPVSTAALLELPAPSSAN